ncbi:helix-turn-helix transcriptional regulator [Streptomyces acidiscabies]|uniref:Helix-turn-helix transcriptional regulator n=1 Tax=Streptomyces acidiscabies TaxID=42234 RepID=A0AAP6B9A5_9ACTN|nr:helix-turn-helix transcriptional regulator [Streptomyces acidiscabies]MBP5936051.1 helix-turn-helix domain-containing protein [Streptomyces sp. LBUM 1476]MBZ3916022.1 helix-turn-helix domain-containing protein [Streptomyces acidiscabies]MDX2960413.1 helix-turn-helix transcriptional regulator [Streptomyces acidiscabies]MDX3017699.1 helix-turn-helix transcriptional regulator [Streptomyces acidiscabies]MDX3794372.1 helix-turn-helix transcriptional regulator [Streptomyces acidiscabies]
MTTTELGRALRRWRDRLSPATAGLPARGQRRAAGLRREELAELAGLSVDYVTRLEQGRSTNPSGQVAEALARALRLTPDERAYLFGLAGLVLPGPEVVPSYIPPSVLRLLDRLVDTPVAVTDAALTVLMANPLYQALLGDLSGARGFERNGAWGVFRGGPGRVRHTPEEQRGLEIGMVSELRSAAGRYPADPGLRRLIAELRASSERFAELWEAGVVGSLEVSRKTIEHPQVGPLTLDCNVLRMDGSGLRILGYSAEPGTEDAQKLELLAVIGIQSMAAG